jgi:hypothetical protein
MSLLADACPRCGYALVQPPPPPPTPVRAAVPVIEVPALPPSQERSGLSAASVPKILLGLGATCLLVAAVIFLAVAWSWLGVGGRTAVLVALTAGAALSGQWLARRDLGVAAEALTTVSLGLVLLDVVGGQDAGWWGTPDLGASLVQLGAALFVASMALCVAPLRLFAPQVAAPAGLGLAWLGAVQETGHGQLLAASAVLGFTGLAVLGRRLAASVLPWVAGAGALLALAALTGLAVLDAAEHPTVRGLWVEGHGLGLAALAALVLLPWALAPRHDDLRQLVCAAAVSVVTGAAALPVLDEGLTAITLTAAAAAVVWAALAAGAPLRWYAVPRVPLLASLAGLAPASLSLAKDAVDNLFTVAAPFTQDVDVRLVPAPSEASPLLLPMCVAVAILAALLTLPRAALSRYAVVGVAGLTVLLTAAQYPVPLLAFVAVLGPLGVFLALPSAVLTLLVLLEIVLLAAYATVRRTGRVSELAGLVLPVALALALWTGGHVHDVSLESRALATLLVVGLLAVAVPRVEVATTAGLSVLVSSAAGVAAAGDPSATLAVHLTVAGAMVVATSLLHRDHRPLAWPGGLLLAAATWVRLYDVGVHAPEPYTLPTAVVLLLVGLHRLRRDDSAGTVTALLPGLVLAVLPTLLWALVDPLSTRAVVAGGAALALLLGGTAVRWTAPVLVGWLAGGALALRELGPYAAQWPQWVLIGTAGAVLFAAGISWEARLRDLRQAAAYLGRLR